MALPPGHRVTLAGYLEQCRLEAPQWRFVDPGGLHVTLRFLGNVERARLTALMAATEAVEFDPIQVAIGGLGHFGSATRGRVVHLALEGDTGALRALASQVDKVARDCGFPAEARPYRPHLTLGRARDRGGAPLPQLPPPPALDPFTAVGFELYRSHLRPEGAEYSVLAQFPILSGT